jgi:hypothetical protein
MIANSSNKWIKPPATWNMVKPPIKPPATQRTELSNAHFHIISFTQRCSSILPAMLQRAGSFVAPNG